LVKSTWVVHFRNETECPKEIVVSILLLTNEGLNLKIYDFVGIKNIINSWV